MNPYQFKTKCSVCGGEGMATIGAIYNGVHSDPNVCRYYLEKKAKEIAEKEKKLDAKEAET